MIPTKTSLAAIVLMLSETDLTQERNVRHVVALNVRHSKKEMLALTDAINFHNHEGKEERWV